MEGAAAAAAEAAAAGSAAKPYDAPLAAGGVFVAVRDADITCQRGHAERQTSTHITPRPRPRQRQ